jgi:hypothetical protein
MPMPAATTSQRLKCVNCPPLMKCSVKMSANVAAPAAVASQVGRSAVFAFSSSVKCACLDIRPLWSKCGKTTKKHAIRKSHVSAHMSAHPPAHRRSSILTAPLLTISIASSGTIPTIKARKSMGKKILANEMSRRPCLSRRPALDGSSWFRAGRPSSVRPSGSKEIFYRTDGASTQTQRLRPKLVSSLLRTGCPVRRFSTHKDA